MAKTERIDQITQALRDRGYRTLAFYPLTGQNVQEFRLYTDGYHVLCLQIYAHNDGFELYQPVSNQLGIQSCIEMIPQR